MNNLLKALRTAIVIIALIYTRAQAASVDTVLTHSDCMHKDIKAVVIRPDHYSQYGKLPVVYLLHGFSGNYADWVNKVPAIASLADQYHLIIVCPDGNYASWYFDSTILADSQYETYVVKELVGWVDKHYATIANHKGRAITGLSMGGHGALYLAIRHQDVFGAAGSMSGGVDLPPFATSFGLDKVLGNYADHHDLWEKSSVINMVSTLKPNSLNITFDCGTEDFFYQYNLNLHNKLLELKIPHDYAARPGGHSWEYWANSINYQMLFFNRFFLKAS